MDKKTKIKFNVLAIFVIALFCFALTPKTLQNDTYYTIAIGEHIMENGIDMQDPFSWHEDLPYTYPHWLYDVATYLVFEAGEAIGIGGFTAIYLVTVVLAITLGIVMYYAMNKICKNQLVSFFITLGVMCFLLTIAICVQLRTMSSASSTVSQTLSDNGLRDEVLKMKEKYDNAYRELEDAQKELEKITFYLEIRM